MMKHSPTQGSGYHAGATFQSPEGGVPFVIGNLAAALAGFQSAVNLGVFLLYRCSGFSFSRFSLMCAYLAAGTGLFPRRDVVAITGVESGGE